MAEHELYDNRFTGNEVVEAVRSLFDADGTVYLTTGYLTWSGYLAIEESVRAFLDRSPDNELYVVVAAAADQFSRGVARALWDLDVDGQVHLLTYRDGFIHPKLYLRDGPDPALAMGSANITWDGLGKNLELVWYYHPDDPSDPIFRSHLEWVRRFVESSDRLTAADLSHSVRLGRMTTNWLSKGRINLPVMARRALPPPNPRVPDLASWVAEFVPWLAELSSWFADVVPWVPDRRSRVRGGRRRE